MVVRLGDTSLGIPLSLDHMEHPHERDNNNPDKPRRLDAETAMYLCDLDSELNNDITDEECEILIGNILEEIKTKTASAASDRRTNYVIEKICARANLDLLSEVFRRLAQYTLFLAQNRFSSHILQTCISRLCDLLRTSPLPENLTLTILNFAQQIMDNMSWLANEINGSHVVRSLLCLLSGIPVICERKGKNSKHQHSVMHSIELSDALVNGTINTSISFTVPPSFHEILGALASDMLRWPDTDLQSMVADPSSCAVFRLFLRILCSDGLLLLENSSADLASSLMHRTLGGREVKDGRAAAAQEVFYAMAGDVNGSTWLETVFELCREDLLLSLVRDGLLQALEEYIRDARANFVVQASCRRLSEVASTTNNKKIVSAAFELLSACAAVLQGDASLVSSRTGVWLWAVSLENALTSHTCKVPKSLRNSSSDGWGERVAKSVLSAWTQSGGDGDVGGWLEKYLNKNKESGALPSDAAMVARLIGKIISVKSSSSSTALCRAVASLPTTNILQLCTFGPTSKFILDEFFSCSDHDCVSSIATSIVEHAVTLACDHVGKHVILRCHTAMSDKEQLVAALAEEYERMQRNTSARQVMSELRVELYRNDRAAWSSSLNQKQKAVAFLDELEAVTGKHKSKQISTSSTSDVVSNDKLLNKHPSLKMHSQEEMKTYSEKKSKKSSSAKRKYNEADGASGRQGADMSLIKKLKSGNVVSSRSLASDIENIVLKKGKK